MKKTCIKYGVIVAILLSCACHDEGKTAMKRFDKDPGFVIDIPVKNGRTVAEELDLIYQYTRDGAELPDLDSLEYGFDSLQIRVWLGHSMAITKHVVIISSTNQQWSGRLITITSNGEKSRKITTRSHQVIPKSGWPDFGKSLSGYNIINMPQSEYNKACQNCGADGIGYSFEIATTQTYRYYKYCNPELTRGCPEALVIMQFATFLEKEFDFTYTK